MKKAISILLTLVMVLALGATTVFAEPLVSYNGTVSGIISADELGHITGTLTGDFTLDFTGQAEPPTGQITQFTGILTGDITGTVAGKMNINGNDSIFAQITVETASGYVYLIGGFPPCGINDYFEGEIITGTQPAEVTDVVITATEGVLRAPVGGTLHMKLATDSGCKVRWGVFSEDRNAGYASIDADGTLHILKMPADGNIIVMVNTLDPNVYSENVTITVTNPKTEVTAIAGVSYTVIIPPSVDFGTIYKTMPVQSKDFPITVQDAALESGRFISVTKISTDDMMHSGSNTLDFIFTGPGGGGFNFLEDGTKTGSISCTPSELTAAGSYKGYMTFTISYNETA